MWAKKSRTRAGAVDKTNGAGPSKRCHGAIIRDDANYIVVRVCHVHVPGGKRVDSNAIRVMEFCARARAVDKTNAAGPSKRRHQRRQAVARARQRQHKSALEDHGATALRRRHRSLRQHAVCETRGERSGASRTRPARRRMLDAPPPPQTPPRAQQRALRDAVA